MNTIEGIPFNKMSHNPKFRESERHVMVKDNSIHQEYRSSKDDRESIKKGDDRVQPVPDGEIRSLAYTVSIAINHLKKEILFLHDELSIVSDRSDELKIAEEAFETPHSELGKLLAHQHVHLKMLIAQVNFTRSKLRV